MTVKDAILRALSEMGAGGYKSGEISDYIIKNEYYTSGLTPSATISSNLGDFIRNGDSRVYRIKEDGGYKYFLASDGEVDFIPPSKTAVVSQRMSGGYHERDLHKILSTYLNDNNQHSKTIYHEKSLRDSNLVWTHPDLISVKFLDFKTTVVKNFSKTTSNGEIYEIISYEIKKDINNDGELKKAFFQALSNSSWANGAYLVFLNYNEDLYEEMYRLNRMFGVGFIELDTNPIESKIIFQSDKKQLDYATMDKLCEVNENFRDFIDFIDKILTVEDKYKSGVEREFTDFCDEYFSNTSEALEYCDDKIIIKK